MTRRSLLSAVSVERRIPQQVVITPYFMILLIFKMTRTVFWILHRKGSCLLFLLDTNDFFRQRFLDIYVFMLGCFTFPR